MATLPTGASGNGTVSVGEWRYYELFVPLDKNHVTFAANLTSPVNSTEIALYVRSGQLPTHFDYTQRAPPNSTRCQVAARNRATIAAAWHSRRAQIALSGGGVAGQWYIGVLGVATTAAVSEPASFTVRGTMGSLCPQRCSEHGRCVQNHCNCQAGYVGDDCSSGAVCTVRASCG